MSKVNNNPEDLFGSVYPERMYKEMCLAYGMSEDKYKLHIKEVITRQEAREGRTCNDFRGCGETHLNDILETKWEDPGPLTPEKMIDSINNFFRICGNTSIILKLKDKKDVD